MKEEMPDYKNYSLQDLFQAESSVNRELYPERAEKIAEYIAMKMKDPVVNEQYEKEQEAKRYSTFGLRFVAAIIDGIILSVVSKIIYYYSTSFGDIGVFVLGTIDIFLFVIYSVLFHGLFCQTVGKMVMGVVLLDAKTEKYIKFSQALLRDSVIIMVTVLSYSILVIGAQSADSEGRLSSEYLDWLVIIAIFNFVWFLTEIATMLFNKKNRALHDFIGGTVVVRE